MVKGAEALATKTMAAAEGSARAPDVLAGMSPQGVPLAHDGDSVQDAAKQHVRERVYAPISSALAACTQHACGSNSLLKLKQPQRLTLWQVRAVHAELARRCT